MGGKHNKCCCAACLLASDNFDRADGPVGGRWYGGGTIVSNVLHADQTRTTVCHPASAPLGSLWSHAMMIDCDPSRAYVVKVGDPAGGYTITVTFAGVVNTITGKMTITVAGTATESYEYPWENANEKLTVCYAPGVQLSAGPSSRVTGEHPDWVTTCIPLTPHDNCWDIAGTPVGNWEFFSGRWDDWFYEIFESEKEICNDCDCYCWEGDVKSCPPDMLYLTITGGCISGTYDMPRRHLLGTSILGPPTVTDWPQNFTWISDPIQCPETTMGFCFIVTCDKTEQSYPKWTVRMLRWEDNVSCSDLGFDRDDPDTLDNPAVRRTYESFAQAKSTSTCDPLNLVLPALVEDRFTCPGPVSGACCGGSLESGVGESPPSIWSVVITE